MPCHYRDEKAALVSHPGEEMIILWKSGNRLFDKRAATMMFSPMEISGEAELSSISPRSTNTTVGLFSIILVPRRD